MSYTREQLQRAAIEAVDLELEHGSDLVHILSRDGIGVEDMAAVAAAVASATVHNWLAKNPSTSEEEQAIIYAATFAAFTRGFGAALQLRRFANS